MTSAGGHDGQLKAALEEYLAQREAGQEPDRQEYLTRFPNCADELREFFADLDAVDRCLSDGTQDAHTLDLGARSARCEELPIADSCSSGDQPIPNVPGYRLLEELGGGSQGTIYKAEQLTTKRLVALKIIRKGAFATAVERIRFQDEVELASRLAHPGIVRVYERGQIDGRDYFAMEYIRGEPLDAHLIRQTLSDDVVLRLFVEGCNAVHYAHQRGVIHRDLKPSNILVDEDGHPHVLDFGLAKRIAGGSHRVERGVTQVGEFAGTWHYASPEQIQRDPRLVDVRSEVYTLGVILYEMVTDAYPYPHESGSQDEIARHILETQPLRPSAIRRDVSHDLETVILRALSKDPDRRYQSAAALADDVRCVIEGFPISAKRDSPWYVLYMALRRHRWRVAAGVGALLGLITFAATTAVLYARAEAARATIAVRMDIVRQSENYLTDKLDELNVTTNVLQAVEAAHSLLPELERLRKPTYNDPGALFSPVVEDMPKGLFEAVESLDAEGYDEAIQWLETHEEDLVRIADVVRHYRFVFDVERPADSHWAAIRISADYWPAAQACQALVAQSVLSFRSGEDRVVLLGLDAARSIALNLGDGPDVLQKDASMAARQRLYDFILAVLDSLTPSDPRISPYLEWISGDPPLGEYRLAMMAERQKLTRLLEAASLGDRHDHSQGCIDLNLLNEWAGGLYDTLGYLTDQHRRIAHETTPQEAVQLIDRLFATVESWDGLTALELSGHASGLRRACEGHHAWPLIRPLCPNVNQIFRYRVKVRAHRTATLLAASLCRYCRDHGEWPATLEEALSGDVALDNRDPYTGLSFGYLLVDGDPILYSLNDDARDDQGSRGEWGQDGTDVVFFPPS